MRDRVTIPKVEEERLLKIVQKELDGFNRKRYIRLCMDSLPEKVVFAQ